MKKLLSRVRAAVDKFDMIADGASVAVGVSGGKDSLALLRLLCELRRFYPNKFTVTALTADPCFFGQESDVSDVTRMCEELGVEHIIRRTTLYDIIFEQRREKNPCALCAKMRRGILHNMAKEAGCDTVALGHHSDDAAETVLMNLFCGGTFGCFSPKSYLSRKELNLIRPLIFCDETQVASFVERYELPVVKSRCPADGNTERARVRAIMEGLKKEYPDIKAKLFNAAMGAQDQIIS